MAAVFGKRHDHILRSIRALVGQFPGEFSVPNFGAVAYIDEKGESRASYVLTFAGFTLLAMGFTGKKALAFKVAYIEAFEAMDAYIKNQREGLQFKYLEKELEYKDKKSKVSGAGREMRAWQESKPKMLTEMDSLLQQMQPSILPN